MAATRVKAGSSTKSSRSSDDRAAGRFKGRTFCFTGTLTHGSRADAAKLIRAEKGKVVENVTFNRILIIAVPDSRGSQTDEKRTKETRRPD